MSALLLALSLAAQAAVPAASLASLDRGRSLKGPAQEAALQSTDWAVALGAQVARVDAEAPELAASLRRLAPIPTRAGTVRFAGPLLREPGAAPVLLARLVEGNDSAELRVALADAAARSAGDWQSTVAALAQVESDGAVRRMLVEVLDKAPLALVEEPLAAATHDLDAGVRAAAARAIGGHEQGAALGGALVPLVSDSSVEVRVEACRSLGWLGVDAGWDALVVAIADESPEVRLRALRALQRIDASRAAQLSEVRAAVQDADAKVSRAAGQILGG
jgi:HEAT repeat protein